jgi:hypothetical protein
VVAPITRNSMPAKFATPSATTHLELALQLVRTHAANDRKNPHDHRTE